jgi:hypothetical protein
MRRREFITLLSGAISVWPFAAHAKEFKEAIPKVGFLFPGPEEVAKSRRAPLLDGLRSEGFREPDQVNTGYSGHKRRLDEDFTASQRANR